MMLCVQVRMANGEWMCGGLKLKVVMCSFDSGWKSERSLTLAYQQSTGHEEQGRQSEGSLLADWLVGG